MKIIPGHRYTVARVKNGEPLAVHVRATVALRTAKQFAAQTGDAVYLRDEAGDPWGQIILPG